MKTEANSRVFHNEQKVVNVGINSNHRSRKESDAQLTEPVIIRSNPTVGNFLDSVKTFDANIDNIGNFVLFQFFTNAQHW